MSTAIIRRVARPRANVLLRNSGKILCARSYATHTEEPDPQLNGYPQLPMISRQTLPAKGWQDPLLRRNFGDTLHEQDEVLSMWGPDPPPLPPQAAFRQFAAVFAGFVAFGFVVKEFLTPEAPAIRRMYPYNGLVREMGGLEENKARAESTIEDEE